MIIRCPMCAQVLSTGPDEIRWHNRRNSRQMCEASYQTFLHAIQFDDEQISVRIEPEF